LVNRQKKSKSKTIIKRAIIIVSKVHTIKKNLKTNHCYYPHLSYYLIQLVSHYLLNEEYLGQYLLIKKHLLLLFEQPFFAWL
jgi:hypothetical protein